MYLSYYKLNKKPFQISTDPTFLWLGKKHQEALSILKYGIEDDKGFLLLTGDVGTGKTTLLNAFVNSLDDDVVVARVSDPGLTKLDFIKYIAGKFGMDTEFETKSEFLNLFTRFLEDTCQAGKKVLLVIDEAQQLTDEILEEIRLLSNIENQDKKLLNIFLVGQNEFNATLEKYKNRALRQRITINYTLYPLEKEETKVCIEYRLAVAGVEKQLFTPAAIDAIHTLSEGFPRVINIICDHALFQGCQNNLDEISDEVIWKISKNLRFAHLPQGPGEPDFSDSSDDDWLEEVSEVPPLSPEEIQKASQPLPSLQQEIAEEQGGKSYKVVVAVPIFIIVFLLSGYLVFEDSKIDAIKDYFASKNKDTVASPIEKETYETPVPENLEADVVRETPEVVAVKALEEATTQNIEHFSDQKKSLPTNITKEETIDFTESEIGDADAPGSSENGIETAIESVPSAQEAEQVAIDTIEPTTASNFVDEAEKIVTTGTAPATTAQAKVAAKEQQPIEPPGDNEGFAQEDLSPDPLAEEPVGIDVNISPVDTSSSSALEESNTGAVSIPQSQTAARETESSPTPLTSEDLGDQVASQSPTENTTAIALESLETSQPDQTETDVPLLIQTKEQDLEFSAPTAKAESSHVDNKHNGETDEETEEVITPPATNVTDEEVEEETPAEKVVADTNDREQNTQADDTEAIAEEQPSTFNKEAPLTVESDGNVVGDTTSESAADTQQDQPIQTETPSAPEPPKPTPEDPGAVIDWLLNSGEKE